MNYDGGEYDAVDARGGVTLGSGRGVGGHQGGSTHGSSGGLQRRGAGPPPREAPRGQGPPPRTQGRAPSSATRQSLGSTGGRVSRPPSASGRVPQELLGQIEELSTQVRGGRG